MQQESKMARPRLPWRRVDKRKYNGPPGPTKKQLYGKVGVLCLQCGRAYINVMAHMTQKHVELTTDYRRLLHDVSLFKWGVVFIQKPLPKKYRLTNLLPPASADPKLVKRALRQTAESFEDMNAEILDKCFQTAKRIIRKKVPTFPHKTAAFLMIGDGAWWQFLKPVEQHNTLEQELVIDEEMPEPNEDNMDNVIPPTPPRVPSPGGGGERC
jgi:hypothetical protein